MRRGFLVLALAVILFWLAGCSSPARTLPPDAIKQPPTAASPQSQPTAIRTLATETAQPAQATPGYLPPATEAAPEASPTETPGAYPAPGALPGEAVTAVATGAPASPFQDCARTPGLVGCGSGAPALKARLAYFDFDPQRLVGLDLETGQGWQVPYPETIPARLAWSNAGAQDARLLFSMANGPYTVYAPDGARLETFASDTVPLLQPDGALSRDGSLHSPEGRVARLEHTKEMAWLLHIQSAEGEKVLPLNANPGDILYHLLDWAPGGQALLAQAYFAGNRAMTMGGQVIAIDAATGSIREFPAAIPLRDDPTAFFAWDPLQPGRAALLETSETDAAAPRLALLDLPSGKVEFPLPEGLLVNSLAWHKEGWLAFSVVSVSGQASAEFRETYPGAGIYRFDPQNGNVQQLVSAPPGAVDGWLHFLAEDGALVYARLLRPSGEMALVEVRARQLSDGKEALLAQKLAGPNPRDPTDFVEGLLAFGMK